MKKPILTTIALSLLAVAAPATVAATPGYDRPGPEQRQADGHQHLVYWATFFDGMSVEMQDLADAQRTDQMIMKGDKHSQQERNQQAKAAAPSAR